jgi:hypothetical protein
MRWIIGILIVGVFVAGGTIGLHRMYHVCPCVAYIDGHLRESRMDYKGDCWTGDYRDYRYKGGTIRIYEYNSMQLPPFKTRFLMIPLFVISEDGRITLEECLSDSVKIFQRIEDNVPADKDGYRHVHRETVERYYYEVNEDKGIINRRYCHRLKE